MKILAVDTATKSCSVAVVNGDSVLAESTIVIDQTHSRHLLNLIDIVIAEADLRIRQLDGFAVSIGPGSFTGLRIAEQSMSSQKVRSRRRITMNEKKIPRQEDEKALYGLDMDIVREGRQYTLSKLDKNAFLNIRHVKKNVLLTVSLFLIALVTCIFTYIPNKKKVNKLNFFMASVIVAFFVKISVPQGFTYVALLLLLGIGLSGAISLGLHVYRRIQPRDHDEKETL